MPFISKIREMSVQMFPQYGEHTDRGGSFLHNQSTDRLPQMSVCRHFFIVFFPEPLLSPFVSQWRSSATRHSQSSKPLKWRPVSDDRCLRDRFQVLRASQCLTAEQDSSPSEVAVWSTLVAMETQRFGPPLTVLTISFLYTAA